MNSPMHNRNYRSVLVLAIVVAVLLSVFLGYRFVKQGAVTWTIVNVSFGEWTGDAHLLEFPGGETWLIDAGLSGLARNSLAPYLKDNAIDHIDKLIITHDHENHYGGIAALLDGGIGIDELYFDLPEREVCSLEPWSMGCDYDHVVKYIEYAEARDVKLMSLQPGQVLMDDKMRGIRFQVLYRYSGKDAPVTITNINDTSAIMRLDVGQISVLFPGDLGDALGQYLADHGEGLDVDLLSVPHHGVEISAPNAFFKKVSAQAAFVSGLTKLWEAKRGERIRKFFQHNEIPVYISDQYTALKIRIEDNQYEIIPITKN